MTVSKDRHYNNFDLIRLLAATQVAVYHGVEHLGLRLPFHDISIKVLNCFPGVPIFFIISGFLITASYERSKSISDYMRNRCLRLFPALWLCFFLSVGLVLLSGYFAKYPPPPLPFALWTASQLTFLQFYNPDFMRAFGVGVLNGSLWTIPVEMQFYIMCPIFVVLFSRSRAVFFISFGAFVIANGGATVLAAQGAGEAGILVKLLGVSFLPWFYMFLLGALARFYWNEIRKMFEGRFVWWFLAYSVVIVLDVLFDIRAHGNRISAPWVIMIGGLVLSGAYTNTKLSNYVLNRNDISYGFYIYHMPVFNFALYMIPEPSPAVGWLAVIAAACLALLSWRLIERPALSLKKYTLFNREAQPGS